MKPIKLQEAIRLALGADDRCVIWRNNSGAFDAGGMNHRELMGLLTTLERGNVNAAISVIRERLGAGPRWVRYGVGKGGSDLLGMNRNGRFLALEVKEGADQLTPEQRMFLGLVRNCGGYSAQVRSPEQALSALENSLK